MTETLAKNSASLDRQIQCVKREIAMRERVYPKRIASGHLHDMTARDELDAMRAVLATLQGLQASDAQVARQRCEDLFEEGAAP